MARQGLNFVVFGATGDLAVKKIFPALSWLLKDGVLPEQSRIIAVSRRDWDTAAFRSFLYESDSLVSKELLETIEYVDVDFDVRRGYDNLKKKIDETNSNQTIIYLSLSPFWFKTVIDDLKNAAILEKGDTKILLEKPFGTDTVSANELNEQLLAFLDASQIYRVDHYLGKETIQALMDEHERSPKLRQILSNKTLARVIVELSETKGIDGRASYDPVGAFRDVAQNHMLEMLAVLLAEYPRSHQENAWPNARAEVIDSLAQPTKESVFIRRGQYLDYLSERGVAQNSNTETAFELKTVFAKGELAGVEVVLKSGKKLSRNYAGISLTFLPIGNLPQEIRFEIQPKAQLVIRQKDGHETFIDLEKNQDAYQNVITDAITGEARRFVGEKEVLAAWRYTDSVLPILRATSVEKYSSETPFYF